MFEFPKSPLADLAMSVHLIFLDEFRQKLTVPICSHLFRSVPILRAQAGQRARQLLQKGLAFDATKTETGAELSLGPGGPG